MANWNKEEAVDFAVSSAREAFDQVFDYKNIEAATKAYRQNVIDTLREYSASQHEAAAFEAFDRVIAELKSKMDARTEFRVEYQRRAEGDPMIAHIATFDNLEDAQLWWDTVQYLRNDYFNNNLRPR